MWYLQILICHDCPGSMQLIRKQFDTTHVIALSMYDDEQTVFEMIKAGARGYLLKNADETEMLHAIYTVQSNGMYYCTTTTDKIGKTVAQNYAHQEQNESFSLSDRDRDIIRLLCQEQGSKEIAATLNISCRAVEGARQRIQEKIGARDMIGIVVYAIKHNIFNID